jgi:hypothetical protein
MRKAVMKVSLWRPCLKVQGGEAVLDWSMTTYGWGLLMQTNEGMFVLASYNLVQGAETGDQIAVEGTDIDGKVAFAWADLVFTDKDIDLAMLKLKNQVGKLVSTTTYGAL